MNFKKIVLINFSLILFIGTFSVLVHAAWAGTVLENFKKLEYEMIFESEDFFLDEQDKKIVSSSRKLNIYKGIWEKLQTKRQELQEESDKMKARLKSFKTAIFELDQEMKGISEEIDSINKDVVTIKKQIEYWKKEISDLKEKIKSNREVLLEYIVHLYKKGNYIYGENWVDNLKTILLSGENMWDIINDIQFKSDIEITGSHLINKYKGNIYKLYTTNVDLEKQQDKIKKLRKMAIIKKKALDDKKELKEKLFSVTKWKEVLYRKYIEEKQEMERRVKLKSFIEEMKFDKQKDELLEKYGCSLVDMSKDTQGSKSLEWKCLEVNNIIQSESRLSSFDSKEKNVFSWPTGSVYGISAYFHDQEYKDEFWSEHDAVDIKTPQWTDIIAPADGYVIYVQPPFDDSYAYVALKHADWYVTVYGHISEVSVKQYDFVNKWQAFAKTWWEYGTNWAWYYSTWPHLHFWVFKDKKYVDPLNYLDISYFSLESLPDKYRYKFYFDFKNRAWFEYKRMGDSKWVFKITWDTESERQKNLLSTYAADDFKDLDIWVEESLAGGIDPTFLICVWLAESSLWNNLKTRYNIWNVWNTDSWSTYSFSNSREWIYRMVRTLNNKILWKYTQIKDLSRYWNKTWSIYASSSYNWHNNIIKCMSHIKWEYVWDDYNFRLSQ